MASDLLLVSDFDGTLLNTEESVREAYGLARGRLFGDEEWARVWGEPWQKWCTLEVKKKKDGLYRECLLRNASLTPFGSTISWNHVLLLTGASRWSVMIAIDLFFGRTNLNLGVLAYNANTDSKHRVLRTVRPLYDGRSFYFDDDLVRGQEACRGTGFTFCHVSDSTVTVFDKKRNVPWTQLSSLLEPMNVCEVSFLPTISHSS